MAFDFDELLNVASKAPKTRPLNSIVLGAQGAGKSSLIGSLGVKTLYVHTTGEDHGEASAKAFGGENIVPACIDVYKGERLSADETYSRLIDLVTDGNTIAEKGFKAVAIDGAPELENLIRSTTQWKEACTTKTGAHDGYAEGKVTLNMMRPIFTALKDLGRFQNIHSIMTCLLDVREKGTNGEVLDASARLQGFQTVDYVIPQFWEVLVVGPMERNGEVKHKLQFMCDLNKTSKDGKTGMVKRAMNFTPCIRGVTDLPPIMDADLKKVLELKGA